MVNSNICKRRWSVAGLSLAAILLVSPELSASTLHENTYALSANEVLLCETPVTKSVEIYGFRQMAEAVSGYRRKISSKKKTANVSFIVAGEVTNPGEYDLRSPVNLLTAVLAAGGPSEDGSMRAIEVWQSGSLLGKFDLYGFLSEGRIADDFVFNGGEQIVVLPHGPQVSITGRVANPAIFELKPEEMRLDVALEIAGGIAESSEAYRVEVVRIDKSRRQVAYSFDFQPGDTIKPYRLESGDQIYVLKCEKMLNPVVYAQLPGQGRMEFACKLNMKISDLLENLQPFSENISLGYAEILREGRLDKEYEVISISIDLLLQQIKSGDFSQDLILRPGDLLMLFDRKFLENKPVVGVAIEGRPLVFVDFKPGMKISDLLEAGSVKLSRKRTQGTVCRRMLSGSQLDVVSLSVDVRAAQSKNQRHDIELQPFDTLQIKP